jgi:hypothetical protein
MRKEILLSCFAFGVVSCGEPTQILVELQTDVPCAEVQSFAYSIASPEEISTAVASKRVDKTSPNFSCVNGLLGTVGIVPNKKPGQEVAVRVSLRFNAGAVDDLLGHACVEGAPGCIWQQVQVNFVAGRKLQLMMPLNKSCQGVRCASGLSCFTKESCQANRLQAVCSNSVCELSTASADGPRLSPLDGGSNAGARDAGVSDASVAQPDASVSDAGIRDAGVDAGLACTGCDAGTCKIECLSTDFGGDWRRVLHDTNGGDYNNGAVYVDGGLAFVLRTRPSEQNFFESKNVFTLEGSRIFVDLIRSEVRDGGQFHSFLKMERGRQNGGYLNLSLDERGDLNALYHVENTTDYGLAGSIPGPAAGKPIKLQLSARADVVIYEAFFDGAWRTVASIPNPTGVALRDLRFSIGNECFIDPLPDGGSDCAIATSVFDNVNSP